jgi:hypothetical protein
VEEELNDIVARMVEGGESEEDIALVIQNWKPQEKEATATDYAAAGVGAFNRGISQLAIAPIKLGGAVQRTIAGAFGYPEDAPLPGLPGNNLEELGQFLEGAVEAVNPRYDNVNQTYQSVSEGIGQGVGMIATAGGSAAPGIAQQITKVPSLAQATGQALGKVANQAISPTGFLGGSMTAIPEYEAAKAAGLSDADAFEVLLSNYAVGQTEALPIQNMLGRLNRVTGNRILNTVKSMGIGSMEEAAQEAVQTYLSNEVAKENYDPDRDPLFQVLESAKVGGMVGFFLPGMVSTAQALSAEKRVKLERKIGELQVDQAMESTGNAELDAQIDAAAQIDPVDKQVLEESKVADAVQQEQKEIEAEEKLQEDLQSEENSETSTAEEAEIKTSQTPEYKAAVAEVQRLQDAFARLPIEENADELLFELRNARQAVQKIAGDPKITKKKTPIQKQIEDSTGVTKPEKSIKMTPNEAIKFRVQEFYKGVQEGVYRGKDASNELVNKVQDAIKESPLQPKQISSILSRIKKTNLFTPGSISRLNNFIDKVSLDAEYAENIDISDKLRSDIKGKLKNATPKERIALQLYSAINPEDVSTIDNHVTFGQLIKKSFKPVNDENYVPLNLESVNKYLDKTTEELYTKEFGSASVNLTPTQRYNEIQKKQFKDRQQERLSKVSDNLGLNLEERQLLLESDTEVEDGIADQNKKELLKEELVNIAKTVGSRLSNVDAGEYSGLLNDIKKVKPEDLSIADLKQYIEVLDRITENNDFGGVSDIAAMGRAQEAFEKLSSKLTKNIKALSGIEADYTASLPQAFKAIFGLSNDAAQYQELSGIKGVTDGHAYSTDESYEFGQMLNKLHKQFDKEYGAKKNGFTTDSIYRRGIYKTLIKHDAAVDGDEYLRNTSKKAIETTIQSFKDFGDSESAKIVEGLYQPFKNASTLKEVEAIMAKIDPAGKRVFDAVVNWYGKYKDDVRRYNETSYNDFSQDIVNYAGETNIKRLGSKPVNSEDSDFSPGSLKPKRLDSSKRFTGNVPKGSVVDLNFDVGAIRHIQDLVFELKAEPYIRQVNAFAKNKQKVLELFGYKEGDADARKKAEDLYSKIFDRSQGIYKQFLNDNLGLGNRRSKSDQAIAETLTAIHKLVYTASLSGITQAPKQYTVLASTAINLGKDAPTVATSIVEIAKNKEAFKNLIKGESVSTRGKESSVINLGEWFDAADVLATERSIKKLVGKDLPDAINNKLNSLWGGLKTLVTTDASAAQISWLAYYKQSLKNQGLEYKGLEEENKLRETPERRESRAFAKQRVDETQVASNPAELAKAAKTRTIAGQLAKAQFMPFGSFALNKKQRLATNAKMIAFGDEKQRAEAVKDTTAAYAETIAYLGVKRLIQATWGTAIALGIREMFNLGDPEDDDKKKEHKTRQLTQDITELLSEMIPTTLMAIDPVKKGMIDSVEKLVYWWYKQDDPDLTQADFRKETGIDLREAPSSKWLDYFGSYGIAAENISSGFEFFAESQDPNKSEKQQRLALLAASLQMGSLGFIPADIRNPVISEYRKQKAAEKENPSSSNHTTNRPRRRPRIRPRQNN